MSNGNKQTAAMTPPVGAAGERPGMPKTRSDRGAVPPQHHRAVPGLLKRNLTHQPGLADAGLALDENGRGHPRASRSDRLAEAAQLLVPAHQRRNPALHPPIVAAAHARVTVSEAQDLLAAALLIEFLLVIAPHGSTSRRPDLLR
jgi:hypothetical protein